MSFTEKLKSLQLELALRMEFVNATEILSALVSRRQLPTLITRSGLSIRHKSPEDPIILLVKEIFLDKVYTGKGFFTPRTDNTVIDLGANIGMFAMYLSGLAPGIHVHCFEPSQGTFRRLRTNIQENKLSEFISTYRYAIWPDSNKRTLLHYGSSGRRSFFLDVREEMTETDELVECVDLQKAVELTNAAEIDLLKIDVEGSELEIIENAKASTWERIKRVVLEYHEELRPGSRERISVALQNAGYRNLAVATEGPVEMSPIGIIQAAR